MSFHVAGSMSGSDLEVTLDKLDGRLNAIEGTLRGIKTSVENLEKNLIAYAEVLANVQEFIRTGKLPDDSQGD